MKIYSKIIMIVCILGLAINVHAQLKVKTNGNVKIGSQPTWPSGGKLEITGKNETLEARLFPVSENIARLWTINSIYAFGFGIDERGYGQIYRNLHSPSAIMTFNSNGYFGIGRIPSYNLDVNGILRVSTTIYSSDERLKSNITPLSDQTINIFKLKSVSYNLNVPILKSSDNIPQTQTMDTNIIISEPEQIDKRLHYGFIAQDVKKIFPELVYEDNEGMLGIDYVSFIPLLINELKQQNEAIENLKEEIEALKLGSNTSIPDFEKCTSSLLYQNYPNPFSESTIIKFKLSNNTNSARLYLYDLHGNQIKSYLIKKNGEASITIKGAELQPGMYLYSLIADGKLIDTKTMILTD
jgi:Chaperone of endosialidase/Secretion system C-terminal sorting domain